MTACIHAFVLVYQVHLLLNLFVLFDLFVGSLVIFDKRIAKENKMGRKIIRRKPLLVRLGFSSATLHRKIAAGEFPPPLVLGPNMRGWDEETVDNYISSLTTGDTPKQVAPGAKRGRKPGTRNGGRS